MSPIAAGILSLVGFLVLALLGLPLAFSFATVGFVGIILIKGLEQGLTVLGDAPYTWTTSYVLCAIPLFVLMGQFAFHSGISRDLYVAAYKWMGRLRGGLALATTLLWLR